MSDYASDHKVPPYSLRQLRNTDPSFYQTVGPFLSRREIVADLGGPVWDDDDKAWTAAVGADGEVLGVIALRKRGEITSLYVTPGSRGQLIGYALLGSVVRGRVGDLKATATEASLPLFVTYGFKETRKRGRFTVLTWKGDDA